MARSTASIADIRDFLAQKRIAFVGISRNPHDFSTSLFDELCRRGYDVVPVNPHSSEIKGRRCFASVKDIQPPVEGALLMTSASTTKQIVRDCAEAGIWRIWLYRAGGQGSVNDAATQLCRDHNIEVIPGECPFMFLPHAGFIHRCHGAIRKITGGFPY